MQTLIKNMTREQLKKVITDNENLQNEVLEILQENESYHIQEILDDLNLSDYSIGLYSYSFIKYSNLYNFIHGILYVEESYNIFGTDENNYIKHLNDLLESEENAKDETEEIDLYNQLEKLANEVGDYITSFLVSCYDFSKNDIFSAFLELYHENYENYYIKNNDYTKIYIMTEKNI